MLRQMTTPKSCSTCKINGKIIPTKEQVVVIHNLSNNHDITTAVEALMKNDALSNSSSIFVLVPVSDDEDDDNSSYGFGSTIGIQLPNNYTRRKKANELEYVSGMPLRRPLSCNLKPCKYDNKVLEIVLSTASTPKQMKISNKLCQITTPHEVTNKLCQITTPCDVTNKLCQITTPQAVPQKHQRHTRFARNAINKEVTNKICQATSPPSQVINKMTIVVGTDTTTDRPCCCEIEESAEVTEDEQLCHCLNTYFTESNQSHTKRMIVNRSQLISPVLVKTEFSAEEFNMPKQSSILESNKRFSSMFPEIDHHDGDPMFDMKHRYIYNTPMSELEENQKSALKSCHCTPEKLRLLLEQVLAEKSLKKTNVCCGSPVDSFGVPKHIHLIDIKCSGCMLPSQKNALKSKLESNRSMDCHCEELFTEAENSTIIQKIASSTLFCLDDPTKIQDLPKNSLNADDTGTKFVVTNGVTKHSTLPHRKILAGHDQPIGIDGRELCSVIEGRSTYNEPSNQRGHNVMIDTNLFKNERGQNNKMKLTPKARPYHGNKSIRSKTKDQIKADLIQALSGFKFLQEPGPPKPTVNFVDDVNTKACLEYSPSKPLTHLHNMSINTDKKYLLKSNVNRTLSSVKHPQKQPSPTHRFKETFEDFLRYYANMNTGQLGELRSSIKKSANNPINFNDKQIVRTEHALISPGNPKDRKVKEDHGLKLRYGGKSSHSKTLT